MLFCHQLLLGVYKLAERGFLLPPLERYSELISLKFHTYIFPIYFPSQNFCVYPFLALNFQLYLSFANAISCCYVYISCGIAAAVEPAVAIRQTSPIIYNFLVDIRPFLGFLPVFISFMTWRKVFYYFALHQFIDSSHFIYVKFTTYELTGSLLCLGNYDNLIQKISQFFWIKLS